MAKQLKSSLMGQVRTRIAPSPTGIPHVGTAFQALLDWVYARRYQGQFVMRLEDTDQKRFIPEAEEVLHQAFAWLKIEPDEDPNKGGEFGPYRQSERLKIYQQYAQQLVEQDYAYHCFCSPERLIKIREQQRQAGQPPKYDRHCRELSASEVEQRLKAGESSVIRLKVPDNQKIVVTDKLRGQVEFDSNTVDDQVLLKSDGFPTYHLAVVVDDHLMQISHVVRGEEWLPSAPKHILLYQYLGWPEPEMIHTPTLRNTDRSKLSKRKGNTSVWWYREQGFLSEALLNFLALMVWKPNETQEIFSKDEMIAKFEWEEMNITGPIFDVKKLEWLNGKYIRKLSSEELIQELTAWITWVIASGQETECRQVAKQLQEYQQQDEKMFLSALQLAQERARILKEFAELTQFYFLEELEYDLDDLTQGKDPQLIAVALQAVTNKLREMGLAQCEAKEWEMVVRETADQHKLSHKDLFMAMRSALTAQKFTPPLYEVMQALGEERSFARLDQAVCYLQQ